MKQIKNVTEFEQSVLQAEYALVDFYSDACMPCKRLAPVLEELASRMPKVLIAKVDIRDVRELVDRYKITRTPTLLFFRKGNVEAVQIGVRNPESLESWVNSFLG